MKVSSQKHEFAFYFPQLEKILNSGYISIFDKDLYHRIVTILRLTPSDTFTLFNHQQHIYLAIDIIKKKEIVCSIKKKSCNKVFTPSITLFLPLLRRSALEEAIYGACELGVSKIQLLHTAKTSRSWKGDKELERLQKIIIAAAEQSKNFSFPSLIPPILFSESIKCLSTQEYICFFDPVGAHIYKVVTVLKNKNVSSLGLIIGPEGDLTTEEKNILKAQQVLFCALTPTVIRAQQACLLATGIMRSCL